MHDPVHSNMVTYMFTGTTKHNKLSLPFQFLCIVAHCSLFVFLTPLDMSSGEDESMK